MLILKDERSQDKIDSSEPILPIPPLLPFDPTPVPLPFVTEPNDDDERIGE